jgi:hypothetical protein
MVRDRLYLRLLFREPCHEETPDYSPSLRLAKPTRPRPNLQPAALLSNSCSMRGHGAHPIWRGTVMTQTRALTCAFACGAGWARTSDRRIMSLIWDHSLTC